VFFMNGASKLDHEPVVLPERSRSIFAIIIFFILAFTWSWGFGFVSLYVMPQSVVGGTILAIVSGFGPSLSGIFVVAFFSNHAKLRSWLVQCLNWRIDWRWYAVAFCIPPAIMLLGVALYSLTGGMIQASISNDKLPLFIANFALIFVVGGPLGEEFGWRGFALPAISARLNWRAASLLVGVIWSVWHLPLFYMAGTPQSHMSFLVFLLSTTAESVMFAWLFRNTGQSIVPAMIMHTSINGWMSLILVMLTTGSPQFLVIMTCIQVLVAAAMLFAADFTPPATVKFNFRK
jgi:uncharacterized protein